jgi:hypothetical protein
MQCVQIYSTVMAKSFENDTNLLFSHDLLPSGFYVCLSDVFITYRNIIAIIL